MTVARNNRALRRVAASFFLLSGLAQTALAEDPGAPGPLPVSVAEYDFGDTAFSPTGFPGMVEVRANVHHPTDLTAGPFPLVIFLHGRQYTCFEGTSVFLQWPCSGSREPIPSFEGYDYLGQVLASHGYVVVSISANGINADDNFSADLGMLARAELIQEHLKHWETFNTVGGAPFGNTFVGAVDLANVGTMGHSRGGEGVVRHFLLNDSLGSPFQIRAVFPLASVDFDRPVINDVPLSVLLPYCDGDVSDLQGVHFYDDARYNVPGDTGRKHTLLVMGANHNFYNTVWTPGLFPAGGVDDWIYTFGDTDSHCGTVPGNGRLSAAAQRGTSLAYVSAFFRTYLGGEVQFLPILTGNAPPPASAMNAEVFASFHSPDDPLLRMDVNRLLDDPNLTTNTLGGAVSQGGLMPYKLCGGDRRQLLRCPPFSRIQWSQQPHTAPSLLARRTPGLSQLIIGWNTSSATYENALPPNSRDVTGFGAFQFRGSVNFHDGRNPAGLPQDLTVVLTDGDGNAEGARVSDYSGALFAPPGETFAIPKVVLNTVQIPLSAFPGIDLADVRTVRFDFDEEPMGALLVTDLAFTSLFPPPVCDANGPYLAECTAPDAPVMLDGTGSTTASANPLSFTWTGPFQGGVAMGPEPIVKFGGLGNFTVDLEVDDGFGWAQCSADVTIEDTTPPVIACSFATPSLPAREHRLVDVGLTAEALDACEGTLPVALRVFSDEDDAEGKGSGRHSPDAKLDPELRLRAERAGRGDGAVYLVVAHATDSSSNASHACCTLGMPHDQSAGARASVDAQAAAAQTYCESFAAPPAGFFAVGDGPEIGPKQ
jgi:hypothetical protein